MQESTRQQYKKLLAQLKRWAGGRPLKSLTPEDIGQYELYLSADRQFAPETVNTHRAAINKFYAGHGLGIRLPLKSTGGRWRIIETIPPCEAERIIAALPAFYAPVARRIYQDLIPPHRAVVEFPSPHGDHITLQSLNSRLAAACQSAAVEKQVRAKMLHQSGIAHALAAGKEPEWIMAQAGIKPSTLARYVRQFGGG